jgi:hypothetical protein
MFRLSSEDEHEERSQGGTRQLFSLAHFRFHDAMDGEGTLHHFVAETGASGEGGPVYETDRETMYELMARYLAGEYEKAEYEMERSPAHEALLDTLEIAAARARAGESEFSFDDLGVAEDWDELDENGEPVEDFDEDEDSDEQDDVR